MAIFVFVSFLFGEAFRFLPFVVSCVPFCQDGLDATFTVPWVGRASGDKVGLVIQGVIFSSIKVYLYHSSLLTSDFRTYSAYFYHLRFVPKRQMSNEKRAHGWGKGIQGMKNYPIMWGL